MALLLDQTGLTARYNFKLEWTPMEGGGARTDGVDAPTLFTAMEEQLGVEGGVHEGEGRGVGDRLAG